MGAWRGWVGDGAGVGVGVGPWGPANRHSGPRLDQEAC